MPLTLQPGPPSPRAVAVDCPAKLNLHLRVGPVRADGFHPLLTWMVTVGLFDRLELQATADEGPPVRLTCEPPTLPCDARNLVFRMIAGWQAHLAQQGEWFPAVHAKLLKRTPTGAGLGGGSSDAACALLAAHGLKKQLEGKPLERRPANDLGLRNQGPTPPPPEGNAQEHVDRGADLLPHELSTFAARFGSDIPFFLYAPSAVCAGRGEIVRPMPSPAAKWAVLLLPPVHMPTPDVYRTFDAMRLGRTQDIEQEPDWQAWGRLPAADLMAQVVNDLEPPAFALRPELADLRRRAEVVAGRPVRMSGSGSSLFTLFDDADSATAAQKALAASLATAGLTDDVVQAVKVAVPIELERTEG